MDDGACGLSPEQEDNLLASAQSEVTVLQDPPHFVLGSQSYSRKAVLTAAGADFDVRVPDIDEKAIGKRVSGGPVNLVRRIALAKADALQSELEHSHPHSVLITGDQVVLFEGRVREKPRDREEAREFIEGYSRSPVGTVGAICLHDLKTGVRVVGTDAAEVHFSEIPPEILDQLADDKLALVCAGGLAIENPLVAPYLTKIEGGVDNVLGLSSRLLASLLAELRLANRALSVQTTPESIRVMMHPTTTMLLQPHWAVVSDAAHADLAQNVTDMLRSTNRSVTCVHLAAGEPPSDEAADAPCFASLSAAHAAARFSVVGAILSPEHGLEVVEQCWRLGIRYLFLQRTGHSTATLKRAQLLGLEVDEAPLMQWAPREDQHKRGAPFTGMPELLPEECRYRRRLQAGAALSQGGSECDDGWRPWLQQYREQMDDWWFGLPAATAVQLRTCAAFLAGALTSRFDAWLLLTRLSGAAAAPPPAISFGDDSCETLVDRVGGTLPTLPEAPSGLHFWVPPIFPKLDLVPEMLGTGQPLVWRAVPELPMPDLAALPMPELAARTGAPSTAWGSFVGGGMVGGAAAAAMLVLLLVRRRDGGATRRRSSAALRRNGSS